LVSIDAPSLHAVTLAPLPRCADDQFDPVSPESIDAQMDSQESHETIPLEPLLRAARAVSGRVLAISEIWCMKARIESTLPAGRRGNAILQPDDDRAAGM